MASRSLNKVELIGNLTRDPELRYTPSGTSVCTFSIATNRQWVTESGEKKEDVEFHRLVAWQKLAEICGKFLSKGRRIWVQGRLQTRSWTGQDGQARQVTEIVLEDMIILDSNRTDGAGMESATSNKPAHTGQDQTGTADKPKVEQKKKTKKPAAEQENEEDKKGKQEVQQSEEVSPDDIPF